MSFEDFARSGSALSPSGTKLDVALAKNPVDWKEISRLCKRVKSTQRIAECFASIMSEPQAPLHFIDVLLRVYKKRCAVSNKSSTDDLNLKRAPPDVLQLPRAIALIWTRVLTGKTFDSQAAASSTSEVLEYDLLPEWKEYLEHTSRKLARLSKERPEKQQQPSGSEPRQQDTILRMPNIECVVRAMEKTVTLVRKYPRPIMATTTATARSTDSIPMPLIHFLVYHNLPPILIWIAGHLYPNDLGKFDAFGNSPLHYATLTTLQWQDWRFRPCTAQQRQCQRFYFEDNSHSLSVDEDESAVFKDASPWISYKDLPAESLHNPYGTILPVLVDLCQTYEVPKRPNSKLRTTPLATFLWSLIDFRCWKVWEEAVELKDEDIQGEDEVESDEANRSMRRMHRIGILRENRRVYDTKLYGTDHWQKDLDALIQWDVQALHEDDPNFAPGCPPFVQPSLVYMIRKPVPKESSESLSSHSRRRPSCDSSAVGQDGDEMDRIFVSMTYSLLRKEPVVFEDALRGAKRMIHAQATSTGDHVSREQEEDAAYRALLTPYETTLFERWQSDHKKKKELVTDIARLRAKRKALQDSNALLRDNKVNRATAEDCNW